MRRTRKAEELLRELTRTAPVEAAEFLDLLGRSDEAIALFRVAAEERPVDVGWRLLQNDLTNEAETLFSRERDDQAAVLGLAAIARRRGDNATAVRLFESLRDL